MLRVTCEPADGGCGWWWYRRKVLPKRWWQRQRHEYNGAHFDNDGCPENLKGGHVPRDRWLSPEQMDDLYGDCWWRIAKRTMAS